MSGANHNNNFYPNANKRTFDPQYLKPSENNPFYNSNQPQNVQQLPAYGGPQTKKQKSDINNVPFNTHFNQIDQPIPNSGSWKDDPNKSYNPRQQTTQMLNGPSKYKMGSQGNAPTYTPPPPPGRAPVASIQGQIAANKPYQQPYNKPQPNISNIVPGVQGNAPVVTTNKPLPKGNTMAPPTKTTFPAPARNAPPIANTSSTFIPPPQQQTTGGRVNLIQGQIPSGQQKPYVPMGNNFNNMHNAMNNIPISGHSNINNSVQNTTMSSSSHNIPMSNMGTTTTIASSHNNMGNMSGTMGTTNNNLGNISMSGNMGTTGHNMGTSHSSTNTMGGHSSTMGHTSNMASHNVGSGHVGVGQPPKAVYNNPIQQQQHNIVPHNTVVAPQQHAPPVQHNTSNIATSHNVPQHNQPMSSHNTVVTPQHHPTTIPNTISTYNNPISTTTTSHNSNIPNVSHNIQQQQQSSNIHNQQTTTTSSTSTTHVPPSTFQPPSMPPPSSHNIPTTTYNPPPSTTHPRTTSPTAHPAPHPPPHNQQPHNPTTTTYKPPPPTRTAAPPPTRPQPTTTTTAPPPRVPSPNIPPAPVKFPTAVPTTVPIAVPIVTNQSLLDDEAFDQAALLQVEKQSAAKVDKQVQDMKAQFIQAVQIQNQVDTTLTHYQNEHTKALKELEKSKQDKLTLENSVENLQRQLQEMKDKLKNAQNSETFAKKEVEKVKQQLLVTEQKQKDSETSIKKYQEENEKIKSQLENKEERVLKKKQGSITLETLPTVTTNQITNSILTFSHQMTSLQDNKNHEILKRLLYDTDNGIFALLRHSEMNSNVELQSMAEALAQCLSIVFDQGKVPPNLFMILQHFIAQNSNKEVCESALEVLTILLTNDSECRRAFLACKCSVCKKRKVIEVDSDIDQVDNFCRHPAFLNSRIVTFNQNDNMSTQQRIVLPIATQRSSSPRKRQADYDEPSHSLFPYLVNNFAQYAVTPSYARKILACFFTIAYNAPMKHLEMFKPLFSNGGIGVALECREISVKETTLDLLIELIKHPDLLDQFFHTSTQLPNSEEKETSLQRLEKLLYTSAENHEMKRKMRLKAIRVLSAVSSAGSINTLLEGNASMVGTLFGVEVELNYLEPLLLQRELKHDDLILLNESVQLLNLLGIHTQEHLPVYIRPENKYKFLNTMFKLIKLSSNPVFDDMHLDEIANNLKDLFEKSLENEVVLRHFNSNRPMLS